MGIGKVIKKAVVGTAKIAGSAVLGAVGTASTIVEYLGAGSNIEILEEMGHGLKSASFNGVRKMWGAENKEYDHSAGDAGRRKAVEIQKEREKIISQREIELDRAERKIRQAEKSSQVTQEYIAEQRAKLDQEKKRVRRSDEELSKNKTGLDRTAKSFDHDDSVPLSAAMNGASNDPGVYILWLDGVAMKCGRSSQNGGVRKRLLEYYGLRYDDRARAGDYWSVSPENREDIVVSWQCCPISKCHELEYKLFKKYGKGPWALRAPNTCAEDSWELLI